ncbi:MAG: ArsR family transcriptional regulator, partial [Tepidibacillus sp.]
IRREFIVNSFMYRENGIYEMNPKEMWAKPE